MANAECTHCGGASLPDSGLRISPRQVEYQCGRCHGFFAVDDPVPPHNRRLVDCIDWDAAYVHRGAK